MEIRMETRDGVAIAYWDDGENRLRMDSVAALAKALDVAEGQGAPLVLAGRGKFFSAGLDLQWLAGPGQDQAQAFFDALHALLARLLAFPTGTAAALNGHTFGAGAILATAMDYRVMRADRGYFCFPEVDLGLTMSAPFDAVLQTKLGRGALHRALITGHRYGAAQAQAEGLVDAAADEHEVVGAAAQRLVPLVGKDEATMAKLKADLHARALATLRSSPPSHRA